MSGSLAATPATALRTMSSAAPAAFMAAAKWLPTAARSSWVGGDPRAVDAVSLESTAGGLDDPSPRLLLALFPVPHHSSSIHWQDGLPSVSLYYIIIVIQCHIGVHDDNNSTGSACNGCLIRHRKGSRSCARRGGFRGGRNQPEHSGSYPSR